MLIFPNHWLDMTILTRAGIGSEGYLADTGLPGIGLGIQEITLIKIDE